MYSVWRDLFVLDRFPLSDGTGGTANLCLQCHEATTLGANCLLEYEMLTGLTDVHPFFCY